MFLIPWNISNRPLYFFFKWMLSHRAARLVADRTLKCHAFVRVNEKFHGFTKSFPCYLCKLIYFSVSLAQIQVPWYRQMTVNVQLVARFYDPQMCRRFSSSNSTDHKKVAPADELHDLLTISIFFSDFSQWDGSNLLPDLTRPFATTSKIISRSGRIK